MHISMLHVLLLLLLLLLLYAPADAMKYRILRVCVLVSLSPGLWRVQGIGPRTGHVLSPTMAQSRT